MVRLFFSSKCRIIGCCCYLLYTEYTRYNLVHMCDRRHQRPFYHLVSQHVATKTPNKSTAFVSIVCCFCVVVCVWLVLYASWRSVYLVLSARGIWKGLDGKIEGTMFLVGCSSIYWLVVGEFVFFSLSRSDVEQSTFQMMIPSSPIPHYTQAIKILVYRLLSRGV